MSKQLSDLESTRAVIANRIVQEWGYAQTGGCSWAYLSGLLDGFYIAGSWEGSAGGDLLLLADIARINDMEVQ